MKACGTPNLVSYLDTCGWGRSFATRFYSKNSLTQPLPRTYPKNARDSGWKPISWDAALDEIAAKMHETKRIAIRVGATV
jgi:anaerobic selenocysteine-containing dehydrogenase